MYSLNCDYYTEEFSTLDELLDDIVESGQDPNYYILFNGNNIGETAANLLGLPNDEGEINDDFTLEEDDSDYPY